MKPKEWWQKNGREWLKKCKGFEAEDKGNSKHFNDEADFIIKKIKEGDYKKILEVGAGNGRIIGKLSALGYKCSSADISLELCEYVHKHYPNVKVHLAEAINLPFEENEFDLVFTHEVLQHVEPGEITQACNELLRVGKEVWNLEQWRDAEKNKKASNSHGGRWCWDLKEYLPVFDTFYTDWGQMFYRSR